MKLSTILIIALIVLICIAVGLLIKLYIYEQMITKMVIDVADEKHFCNYCKDAYFLTKKDRELTHCKKCGRPLTIHKAHPDFSKNSNHIEQIDLPFEEFNEKEQ